MSSFSKVLMSVAALNGVFAINMDNADCERKLGKGASGRGKKYSRDYNRFPLTAKEVSERREKQLYAERYNAKHRELLAQRNQQVAKARHEISNALQQIVSQGSSNPLVQATVRKSEVSRRDERARYYFNVVRDGKTMPMYAALTYTDIGVLQEKCPGAPAMPGKKWFGSTSPETRELRGRQFVNILNDVLARRDHIGTQALLDTFFPVTPDGRRYSHDIEALERFKLFLNGVNEVHGFDVTRGVEYQIPSCDVHAALAAEDRLNAIAVVASEESQEELGGEQAQQPEIKIEMPKQGNIALQASVLLKQASLKTTTTGAAA